MDEWQTFEGWRTAHRVGPAGGSGRWRTSCGRITPKTPLPAEEGMDRCGGCVEHERGLQRNRPVAAPAR